MAEQKYSLHLSKGIGGWESPPVSATTILKGVSNLASDFYFAIKHNASTKPVAHIYFSIDGNQVGGPFLKINVTSENKSLVLDFFKTFKQSPFRLLELAVFTLAKKKGVRYFFSDSGIIDSGRGHKKQIRQKIFRHVFEKGVRNKDFHELGIFPKLELNSLVKILQAEKPVPIRLLPPESVLRKVRANSYAAFRLKRIGRKKYVAERRVQMKHH